MARLCLLGSLGQDPSILEAAQTFNVPVIISTTGVELINEREENEAFTTYFVTQEFEGPWFETLCDMRCRVLGPTALKELAQNHEPLPASDRSRPMYSLAMRNIVTCFTGYRKETDVRQLAQMVHHMGGSLRKDIDRKVTHLIAGCPGGEKYRYARTFGVPVMSETWVTSAWENRHVLGYSCSDANVIAEHKLKFGNARVCFLGFSPEETEHMSQILVSNKGIVSSLDDPHCNYLVLDNNDTYDLVRINIISAVNSPFNDRDPDSRSCDSRAHHASDFSNNYTNESDLSNRKSHNPEKFFESKQDFDLRKVFSFIVYLFKLVERRKTEEKFKQLGNEISETENNKLLNEDERPEVVDESNVFSLPETPPPKARVVKAEWFWASVQDEICADEKEYLFEDVLDTITSPDKKRYQSTPISGGPSSRARKRKRLQQKATLSQFESPLSHKRRSSISDAGLLSISGSYLDCTATPEKDSCDEIEGTSTTKRNVTGRYLVFDELVTTETNYVGILDMILKLYKTPLEEMAESNNVLLSPHEVKTIFGKLPAIYEVHKAMLEELKMGRDDWKEEFNIGEIIYKYAEEFQKCYPLFINNLENIKLTLEECDVNRPRFHAFLKRIQNKSESNREPLKDLLIRPVQRLPSIILLLNDLLKRTDKQNPDHRALEKAIAKMKEATSHINENKGKTEMQLAMFDLFNEIENCPPHLISSHRNLISKCECVELTEILSSKKGDILVLLLFTDALEICKKRVRSFNSFRSTKPSSLQKVNKLRKPYKHIRLMPLSNLRKVIDVKESDECRNVFALLCPSDQSLEKNLCSFTIIDESVKKSEFLNQICKQLAQTVCKPNPKDFYDTMDSNDLNVDTASSVSLKSTHSFSTALRFASKTGVKVGRALSISKTPNRLIKAMSTALPFSGHESLPRSTGELARMRLQSCANLNELNCTPPRDFSSPVTPMSVQPTRRNMLASAFSVSSLKLL